MSRPPISDDPATLKVLDLGIMIAGPIAATILGDLGAEVVKVEKPMIGDLMRYMGPGPQGMSRRWQVDGRNKRSIELDIRTARGQDIVRGLAGWADVLVENMRPGTLDRYGLGYRQLREVNPRLVYVSCSGFGQTGPLRDHPGYDFTGGAFGGLTYPTGFPDRPPVLPGLAVVDHCTGLFALIGALEAIRRRDAAGATGTGEWIDVGLYEPMVRMAGDSLANAALDGIALERSGSLPIGNVADSPHGFAYETADGHYLSIYAITDEQFERLRTVLSDPALEESAAWNIADRTENAVKVDRAVRSWTTKNDRSTVLRALTKAGVPHSVINSAVDIIRDPHVAARENLTTVTDFEGNTLPMQGVLPRLHERPGSIRWSGEPLGASTRQVLGEVLGMTSDHIDGLMAAGVVSASTEGAG